MQVAITLIVHNFDPAAFLQGKVRITTASNIVNGIIEWLKRGNENRGRQRVLNFDFGSLDRPAYCRRAQTGRKYCECFDEPVNLFDSVNPIQTNCIASFVC